MKIDFRFIKPYFKDEFYESFEFRVFEFESIETNETMRFYFVLLNFMLEVIL